MNSGLIGALGAAPLQTVKNRLGSFRGTRHLNLLLPKDGALVLGPPPDGTVNGGNKRGLNAVDFQVSRSASSRVASGLNSVIIGGQNNTASDSGSIAGGSSNTSSSLDSVALGSGNSASGVYSVSLGQSNAASGAYSFAVNRGNVASGSYSSVLGGFNISSNTNTLALGSRSLADRSHMIAYASGMFASTGDSQRSSFIVSGKTTTNVAVELYIATSTRLTIPSGKIFSCLINIVGTKSDGSTVAQFVRKACIKNVGGLTELVNSVETIGTDSASGTSVLITADDTNDALKIEVTGIASETWRWVASIEGVEVAYGT